MRLDQTTTHSKGVGSGPQVPSKGSHTPSLHWSPSAEQSLAAPPHDPALHPSFTVHGSPSSQVVPLQREEGEKGDV